MGFLEPDLVDTSVGKWSPIICYDFLSKRYFSYGRSNVFLLEETKMIHAITSGQGFTPQTIDQIKDVATRVDAIIIREKQLSLTEIDNAIAALLQAGISAKQLIIHTYVELAYKYDLLGCHFAANQAVNVTQHPFICGQSTHTKAEALQSAERGMHYLYFSPVFPTTCKPNVPAQGLQALAETCRTVKIPVLALGGITSSNAQQVMQVGAQGYAAISMFFN